MRNFSLLMATPEAAARLGLSPRRLLGLVRAGRLRVAGQDLDGRMLYREHDVARLAGELCDEKGRPAA